MSLESPIALFAILFLGPVATSIFFFLAYLVRFGQVIVEKDDLYVTALRAIETLKEQLKEERERTQLLMSEASTRLEDADRLVALAAERKAAPKKRSRARAK